jgi:[ribosomal protein S5]-alanine N-acetyltransferase
MTHASIEAGIRNLSTDRLFLRLPDVELAPSIAGYFERNRGHFSAYCPRRPPEHHGEKAWQERAPRLASLSLSGEALHLLLVERSDPTRVIGDINFTAVARGAFQACFLGYQLDEPKVGHGFMSEALGRALEFVLGDFGLHRVMANYVPTNERSERLLKRLGFTIEGYARDYLFLDGQWKDHILTSKTNPNWTDNG